MKNGSDRYLAIGLMALVLAATTIAAWRYHTAPKPWWDELAINAGDIASDSGYGTSPADSLYPPPGWSITDLDSTSEKQLSWAQYLDSRELRTMPGAKAKR